MTRHTRFERRWLLRGLGGVVVGLPALDIFERRALAAPPTRKIYSALILQQNGLVQGPHTGGGVVTAVVPNAPVETDMFWPRELGALSATSMTGADADRATSELSDYASKLIFLPRTSFHYSHPQRA